MIKPSDDGPGSYDDGPSSPVPISAIHESYRQQFVHYACAMAAFRAFSAACWE